MQERGLTLSAEKTLITHSEDGFDFLGQQVRKYNGKLIIKPSKKNVKAFLEKVRKVVKEHQGVEPHYPVAKHKTPLRRRTLGRSPRVGTDAACFFGRPRLFGGTQGGGAI